MKKTGLLLAAGGALLAAAPAWAHHSHAMFDTSKEEDVMGTVKEFTFTNPHVYLYLMSSDQAGKIAAYTVEGSFVGNMENQGIGPNTFKPGDKITVRVNPLKAGRPGGSYTGAIDAAGGKHGSMADKAARPGGGAAD